MNPLLSPFDSVLDNIASEKKDILKWKKINKDKLCEISNIELQLKKTEEEHNKLAKGKLATIITKTNSMYQFGDNTNKTVRALEQGCSHLKKKLDIAENKTKEDKKKYDEIILKNELKWDKYKMIYSEFPLVKQHHEQLPLLKLTNFNLMLVKQKLLERKEELKTMENIKCRQLQLQIIQVAEIFVSGVKFCKEKTMMIRDIRKFQDEIQKMKREKEKLDIEMVNAPQNRLQGILASFRGQQNKQPFSLPHRADSFGLNVPPKALPSCHQESRRMNYSNFMIPQPDFIPSRKLPRLSKELFHDNILTSALYKSAMEIEYRSSTGTDDNADSTLMETTTHIQTQESETTHQAEDNDLSSCTPPSTSVPNAGFDDFSIDDSRRRAYLLNLKKSPEFHFVPRKLVSNSSTKITSNQPKTNVDRFTSPYFQTPYPANVLSNNSTAQLSNSSTSNNSNKEWQHLGISSQTTDSTQNINHINKQGNVEPDKDQNVEPTHIIQETGTPMQKSTYNVIVNTTDDTEAYQTATREIMKENNTNSIAEDYQKPASKTTALINNDVNKSSDPDFPMMYGIQTDNSFNILCLSPDMPEECADSNFLGVTASNAGMTSSENGLPFNFKLPPIPTAASLFGGGDQPAGHKESSDKTAESFFDFDSRPTGTSGPSNMFQLF